MFTLVKSDFGCSKMNKDGYCGCGVESWKGRLYLSPHQCEKWGKLCVQRDGFAETKTWYVLITRWLVWIGAEPSSSNLHPQIQGAEFGTSKANLSAHDQSTLPVVQLYCAPPLTPAPVRSLTTRRWPKGGGGADIKLCDSDYVYMDINTPILIRLRQYSD